MIGETLSHYKILEKLGAGGMGEVYLAEDTTLKRKIALKVLPPDLASNRERLERFQREAEALAALNHPNIVHVYSVEEDEGTHFLTMELVEGKPLSRLISKRGMPLERIFDIAIPLADALATAHEKGVIHRDLKPANIMVTDEGRVKVLDFGLAKLRQEAEALLSSQLPTEPLTGEGRIIGTMPYMSPEQLEGKDIDSRSDIFSLGVVLYEMATGERPFKGDTSVSIISSIVKDEPRPVDAVKEDLPHHLARIIRNCLEKEPARRYQSALDVRNELERLRQEETSQAAVLTAPVPESKASKVRRWWPVAAGVAVVVIALVVLWTRQSETPITPPLESSAGTAAAAEAQPPMIVVLPFENLGAPEDEYFADGMTEEIASRLAVVSGLRVISRTSAMQYKENRPSLKQIGAELGVDYVLEGSVRWARAGGGSRVRITPQLIRVADDSHLWADSYDRVIEDIFAIQSDIASRVIQQLGVTLQALEQQEIETRPTENLEAYQAYLRGKYLEGLPDYSEQHRERIIASYSQAIELDPDFAIAHAGLAHAHSFFYRLGHDQSDTRRKAAKEAVERAMALNPNSPQVLYGVGFYYYYVEQDYDEALRMFTAAADILPNDADIFAATAFIWRRQGRWDEATERLQRAFELSPRDAQLAAQLGEFALEIRDYEQALRYFDLAIILAPDVLWPYKQSAFLQVMWKGDLAKSRRILEALPAPSEEDTRIHVAWFEQWLLERDFAAALDLLEAAPINGYQSQSSSSPVHLLQGQVLRFLGDSDSTMAAFEAARVEIEAQLEKRPDDFRLHSALGLTYAGLGRKAEAIQAGRKAVELQPVAKDAYIGCIQVMHLAEIYSWVGETSLAVDRLDYLLSIPCSLSVPLLRSEPRWDPLRDHPRFQALLEKYGQEG